MSADLSHSDLVLLAVRWLTNVKRCPVVITEMTSGSQETPDAIGWMSCGMSHLVECKVSRADFLADRDKWFRQEHNGCEHLPMGSFRWYLTPAGLIKPLEIKGPWGLLETNGKTIRLVVDASYTGTERRYEFCLLTSALRRITNHPGVRGMRVKIYTNDVGKSEARATITTKAANTP